MINMNRLKLGILLTFVLFISVTMTADNAYAVWFNTDWGFKQRLTINSSQVSADLTNFPVLVSVTDPNLRLMPDGNIGNSNGGDILFTSADELTQLDHEIELYNSATGQLTAWVKIPNLLSTVDTVIYMYFGNPGAASQWNINGTWDEGGANNYVGVWHLSESSGNHTDSTGNVNGTRNGNSVITGNIANAQMFNAVESDFIDLGNNYIFQYDDPFAISAWVKRSSTGTAQMIAARDNGDKGWRIILRPSGQVRFIMVADCCPTGPNNWFIWADTNGAITDTTAWHHIAAYYPGDGQPGSIDLFVDGVQSAVTTSATTIIDHDYTFGVEPDAGIGANNSNTANFFDGDIDELRISADPSLIRTEPWFQTSYNNQSNPASFVSFGLQQMFAPVPAMTQWGMIVFIMLAGFGAIYYIKKRRFA